MFCVILMFSQTFSNFLGSPQSRMLEEYSSSTETPQFSIECESNPELNYTKFINLEESDEGKRSPSIKKEILAENNNNGNFFKPIFSNLQQYVSTQLNQSDYLKLIEKSKRIIKRENAKKRVKMAKLQKKDDSSIKEEENQSHKKNIVLEKTPIKTTEKSSKKPSDLNNESVNVSSNKDMKKVIQKLRNRMSAQQSRDKKKTYLENLEKENQLLQEEIKALKEKKLIENGKDEKKLNPLGILKLGMAFISLFTIIVSANNQTNGSNALKEIKGCQGDAINDSLNILERMSFWKKMELDEIDMKFDKETIMEMIKNIKMYFFLYFIFLIRIILKG